jgi:hypothetical protein
MQKAGRHLTDYLSYTGEEDGLIDGGINSSDQRMESLYAAVGGRGQMAAHVAAHSKCRQRNRQYCCLNGTAAVQVCTYSSFDVECDCQSCHLSYGPAVLDDKSPDHQALSPLPELLCLPSSSRPEAAPTRMTVLSHDPPQACLRALSGSHGNYM